MQGCWNFLNMSWGDIFRKRKHNKPDRIACVKVACEYLIDLILHSVPTRASAKQN